MANETEYSNLNIPSDVLSRAISPALVKRAIMLPLIHLEEVDMEVKVKKFQKDGSLTAEELAESAAYTFGAKSEFTQSAVTSTATKFVCVSKVTVETLRFKGSTFQKVLQAQYEAILRDMEDEVLALTSGFSTQVTATSTLTVDDILDAQYNVTTGVLNAASGLVRAVVDPKAMNEIAKQLAASSAAVWSQESMVSILKGLQNPNGYVGNLLGVDMYRQVGLPTSSSDDVGMVFDPELAIAGQLEQTPRTLQANKVSEGMFVEVGTYCFGDFVEWNDGAGCGLLSDT